MRYHFRILTTAQLLLASALATTAIAPLHAQAERDFSFDLPEQPLADALDAIARTSGESMVAPAEIVERRQAPAVRGAYTVREALDLVLADSGLRIRRIGSAYVVEGEALAFDRQASAGAGTTDTEILVTGTRLRGTAPASTVIRIDREEIRRAGQANLGEVARSLPQSFGGGQNPGIGFNVPNSSGVNVGSGASFNLRGLGSDATLTLLNGKRLPYSSSANSIDVSAIPVLAVDRIEIVPDGSSALYGSDAVAGVVNIVLRDRIDGIETSARLGASTEGGNVQQNYSAIAGTGWDSGSGFIAYEYEDVTGIRSDSRDYAASRPGQALMPPTKSHRVLANIEQALPGGLRLVIDALYNTRQSARRYATNPAGDLALSSTNQPFDVETYALAPSLGASLGTWQLTLGGTYGRDVTEFRGDFFTGTTLTGSTGGEYTNLSRSLEAGASGELLALPAGPLRLALGAGLRVNDFELFRGAGVLSNIDARQNSRFAYAEAGIPLVSPGMDVPFIERLELNAALRHERYRGIGKVTTPKLGLIYAPVPDLTLKASWGRSFRAPTFIQQFQVRQAILLPAAVFTGSDFPAGSTALVMFGGNPDLVPERARSWSVSAAVQPRAIPGLSVEASYFATRYIDRIVAPVPFLALALSDPLYAGQVTLDPSEATQTDLIASSNQFLNLTGAGYDPELVVALVDTSNVNAGRQRIRGVDLLLRYEIALGSDQTLSISGNASHLDSEQQLTAQQPARPLAGLLFSPPKWRARGSITWSSGPVSASAFLSRIGGVTDPRTAPEQDIRGMTTVDLSASYRVPSDGGRIFRDLAVGIAVQNVFDADPAAIATTAPTDTPYDSTNYSPAGRVVSVQVSKTW